VSREGEGAGSGGWDGGRGDREESTRCFLSVGSEVRTFLRRRGGCSPAGPLARNSGRCLIREGGGGRRARAHARGNSHTRTCAHIRSRGWELAMRGGGGGGRGREGGCIDVSDASFARSIFPRLCPRRFANRQRSSCGSRGLLCALRLTRNRERARALFRALFTVLRFNGCGQCDNSPNIRQIRRISCDKFYCTMICGLCIPMRPCTYVYIYIYIYIYIYTHIRTYTHIHMLPYTCYTVSLIKIRFVSPFPL